MYTLGEMRGGKKPALGEIFKNHGRFCTLLQVVFIYLD